MQASAAIDQKDYNAAISFYNSALETTPRDHIILGNRAAAYLELGLFDEVISDAEKCIEIKPDYDIGYEFKGRALKEKGLL